MSARKNKTFLTILIALPVLLMIAGAFALSVSAVIEDLRFVNATDQILALVGSVRSIASQQSGFAQTPGEDVWNDLEKAGQVIQANSRFNPWHGNLRAVTVASAAMRIENDLPTHDCRRLALYFLGRKPSELGLLAIEAQADGAGVWTPLDLNAPEVAVDRMVGVACGKAKYAHLAVVFTGRFKGTRKQLIINE